MRTTLLSLAAGMLWAQAPAPPPPSYQLTDGERQQLRARSEALAVELTKVRDTPDRDLLPDIEIYHKAAQWILRHEEEFFTKAYVMQAMRGLDRGIDRARELAAGKPSWPQRKGQFARAYRSRVDGSVQPYGIVVPGSYDGTTPMRLDVVLHGRGATLNEVSFLNGQDTAKPPDVPERHLVLHVFGRGNNAYRWAGESDVFEALESVRRRYKVDPNQIVLRGFSMGGAGAWHIGLHYPDQWAAVEAGAGFTETLKYAKQESAADFQKRMWTIYDAVEYTMNAFDVPIVGYGGEIDPQLQASRNIQERLVAEGLGPGNLRALFLVGPGTAHKWHPDSKKESDAFLDKVLAEGPRNPDRVRFVTYTTRYNKAFWVTIDALEEQYNRAEVDARRTAEGITATTRNVARITLPAGRLTIDGQSITNSGNGQTGSLEKRNGKWTVPLTTTGLRKVHGLQGPIDDAFRESFLCVKPAPGQAPPLLEAFAREHAKWLRGDVRVKDAKRVTREDMREHNLILFGDPASNPLIAQIAARLPVGWNKDQIVVGKQTFPAATHTLALIYPNPLNPGKYVVINSGYTMHEAEFKGTNALLYPRLGDYAVLTAKGEVAVSGFFDEFWKLH